MLTFACLRWWNIVQVRMLHQEKIKFCDVFHGNKIPTFLTDEIDWLETMCHYRLQRSWGKVIFSQASVILFTGGGGGVLACLAGFQAHTQGGSLGGSGWGWGNLQAHTQWGS